MADASTFVQYDKTHPITLTRGGEPVGITINIVSFDSERVSKAIAKLDAQKWEAARTNEEKVLTPEQRYDFAVQQINEMVIASIDSWDFGGLSWDKLPADPECNEENKRYLINHHNAKWIKDVIFAKGQDIENFFGELPKPSKKK